MTSPAAPSRTSTAWRPLLHEAEAETALAIARDIAGALELPPPSPGLRETMERASLGSGAAGQAVLHAYLYRASGEEAHAERGVRCLEAAVAALAETQLPPALYSGFSGIAWAVSHLKGCLVEEDAPDLCADIDDFLAAYLERSPSRESYELVSGLVGLGVYALERLPRSAAVRSVRAIVARLGETAEARPEGLAWISRLPSLRTLYPDGFYDLGMAHGVPGIVTFLARAHAAGVDRASTGRLLEGAVSWVLTQARPEGSESRFLHGIGTGSEGKPCRLGWCYGDPGVAVALLQAAQATGEAAWRREALRTALFAARNEALAVRVNDPGLCHGSAGLAHIFNRLHQANGDEELGEAALAWTRRTMSARTPGEGVAGYRAIGYVGSEIVPFLDHGFLNGATGIGLSLLAAATGVPPEWDRILLVSAAPASARCSAAPAVRKGWPSK